MNTVQQLTKEEKLQKENTALKRRLRNMIEIYNENLSLHAEIIEGRRLKENLSAYLSQDDFVYKPNFISEKQKAYITYLYKKYGMASLSKAKRKLVKRFRAGGLLSEYEAHQLIQKYNAGGCK
ncbi:hypothetical protein [Bacillus altitudinis]|uniref:hypothetical protein n=1 Tax=Bacillus altitudinis TaxID=293387 RepID=UPI0024AE091D|nr:hypothetical protein [Bacillus altitudinis]